MFPADEIQHQQAAEPFEVALLADEAVLNFDPVPGGRPGVGASGGEPLWCVA